MRVGVQQATSQPAFRKKVSDNNKQRWRDEEYRKRMEMQQNDPNYRALLSKKATKKWEDEEYRRRVLESRLDKPTDTKEENK